MNDFLKRLLNNYNNTASKEILFIEVGENAAHLVQKTDLWTMSGIHHLTIDFDKYKQDIPAKARHHINIINGDYPKNKSLEDKIIFGFNDISDDFNDFIADYEYVFLIGCARNNILNLMIESTAELLNKKTFVILLPPKAIDGFKAKSDYNELKRVLKENKNFDIIDIAANSRQSYTQVLVSAVAGVMYNCFNTIELYDNNKVTITGFEIDSLDNNKVITDYIDKYNKKGYKNFKFLVFADANVDIMKFLIKDIKIMYNISDDNINMIFSENDYLLVFMS